MHSVPGVTYSPQTAHRIGLATLIVITFSLILWHIVPIGTDDDTVSVTLVSEQVGPGIGAGTAVRVNGIQIGSVSAIDFTDSGVKRINLDLDPTQLSAVSDSAQIQFAPGNLFGISELVLKPVGAGKPLSDGMIIDLTGTQRERVIDATMSRLLAVTGDMTGDVLTPQFTSVVAELNAATKAFAPLLSTLVLTSEAIAQTQRVAVDYLFDQTGSALSGAASTFDGVIYLFYSFFTNEFMSVADNQRRYDEMFTMLRTGLLPGTTTTLGTARDTLGPTVDVLASVYPALSRVLRGAATAAEVQRVIDRLDAAIRESPDGPVLALDVQLQGVPALTQPLAGAMGQGGDR